MKFHVRIATCNRPQGLYQVLHDLNKEADRVASVVIADDSDETHYPNLAWCIRHFSNLDITEVPIHGRHGRSGYDKVQSALWQPTQWMGPDEWYVMLADDIRLCRNFFQRLTDLWKSPKDDAHAFGVFVDASRKWGSCWTNQGQGTLITAEQPVRVQWVDGLFSCTQEFANTIREALPDTDPDQGISSGVWRAVSVLAHSKSMGMYLVPKSLVVHKLVPSRMHEEVRKTQPLHTYHFIDGAAELAQKMVDDSVTVALATVPDRVGTLEDVVGSLSKQASIVCVHLNGHKEVPSFLNQATNVFYARADRNVGDSSKFTWAADTSGYYMTCDDDFIYPDDYVERTILGIERYKRKAVVSWHGAVLHFPMLSYYGNRRQIHWNANVLEDEPAHAVGTGVSGWHGSLLRPRMSEFRAPNMADVWFSALCQKSKIPRVVLAHQTGWLKYIEYKDTIFDRAILDDRDRTAAILEVGGQWELMRPPELPAVVTPARKRR